MFESFDGKTAKYFAKEAINDAKQHKIKKFLVDVRGAPNIASSYEDYALGYRDMKQFELQRDSRIAVLADANDTSHDFVETVFSNAGYKCRIFSDEETALKWLRE